MLSMQAEGFLAQSTEMPANLTRIVCRAQTARVMRRVIAGRKLLANHSRAGAEKRHPKNSTARVALTATLPIHA
jgi:hypothetical protein